MSSVRVLYAAVLLPCLAVPVAAQADFFDGARKTFESDIPHFFQDDIPCAFGGEPTSHTKATCKSGDRRQAAPAHVQARPTAPPTRKVDDPGTAGR